MKRFAAVLGFLLGLALVSSAEGAPAVACHSVWAGGVQTCDVDMREYGAQFCPVGAPRPVCLASLSQAVQDARLYFADRANPGNVSYVIRFGAGTIDFSSEQGDSRTKGAIDVSGVQPPGTERLVFRGQGPLQTTLISPDPLPAIYGRHVSHVAFEGLTLSRPSLTATQGKVVGSRIAAIDGDTYLQVILAIPPGFPAPAGALFDRGSDQGRFLRAYTDSATDPSLIDTPDNAQQTWGQPGGRLLEPTQAGDGDPSHWVLTFNLDTRKLAALPPSWTDPRRPAIVCVKSKVNGQAYFFDGTGMTGGDTDITFRDIRWLKVSRGVFRGGITNVKVLNASIERTPAINGQVPCLSSSAGGPQIGQPDDAPTSGNAVIDFRAQATGDDSIAFFNDTGTAGRNNQSVISNAEIGSSFARFVNLYQSCHVRAQDVRGFHCGNATPQYACPLSDTSKSSYCDTH